MISPSKGGFTTKPATPVTILHSLDVTETEITLSAGDDVNATVWVRIKLLLLLNSPFESLN